MKPVITPVHADDTLVVIKLLQNANLPVADLPIGLPHFFKAAMADTVVGVVGLELYQKQALLRSLAVVDEYRSRAVGKYLYEAVVQYAQQQQVEELYLLTNTAEAYFARHGFEKTDRSQVPETIQQTQQFQGVCPSSATVMKLCLNLDL